MLQDNIHTNRIMAIHLNRNEIMIRTIQSNIKHWTEGVIHQPAAATNSTYIFIFFFFFFLFCDLQNSTFHTHPTGSSYRIPSICIPFDYTINVLHHVESNELYVGLHDVWHFLEILVCKCATFRNGIWNSKTQNVLFCVALNFDGLIRIGPSAGLAALELYRTIIPGFSWSVHRQMEKMPFQMYYARNTWLCSVHMECLAINIFALSLSLPF